MTTLAKMRIKINKLDEQIQTLKKEFEKVIRTLADKTNQPLGNKKGD